MPHANLFCNNSECTIVEHLHGPMRHASRDPSRDAWVALQQVSVQTAELPPKPTPAHSVYFIQAGSNGPIKIGYSSNVAKRIETLQTGNAISLRLLASFSHPQAPNIERTLHEMFGDLRMEGEWFRYDARIVNLIDMWRLFSILAS